MKLAFSTNAYARHSLATAIADIAGCGYSGVEILADKPHWYPDRFDAAVAAKIRKLLDKYGLAVSNINANCTFGYWKDAPPEPFFEPSLMSPLAKLRRDRARMIRNTLRFAKAIGADNISITSGKALPTMPPDKALQTFRESLKPILDMAQKLHIHIGIECEPGLLVEWATELRDLIDTLGSPMLGANLDIGHSVVLGEDVPSALKLLRGRIWNCHIEDLPGRKHYHLIPGLGTFDFAALKRSLDSIGYERFVTVELYTYPDQPKVAARQSIAHLRKVMA